MVDTGNLHRYLSNVLEDFYIIVAVMLMRKLCVLTNYTITIQLVSIPNLFFLANAAQIVVQSLFQNFVFTRV